MEMKKPVQTYPKFEKNGLPTPRKKEVVKEENEVTIEAPKEEVKAEPETEVKEATESEGTVETEETSEKASESEGTVEKEEDRTRGEIEALRRSPRHRRVAGRAEVRRCGDRATF